MIKWHSGFRKLSELKPAEYNPRKATKKQYQDLKKSIEENGVADPLIINLDNTIIGGHFRYKVLIDLYGKDKEVPVMIPERKLTEDEEKRLNIRLNYNQGSWDWDMLANFDMELLKDVGWESKELDTIFTQETEEDNFQIPKEPKYKVRRGDIFILGNHRLMCGDATSKEDVEKLMGGNKADMVFTDPPYGMNLDTDFRSMRISSKMIPAVKNPNVGKLYDKVIGDEKGYDPEHIFEFFRYCKEIFLWGADYYAEKISNRNKGSWIVWDKTEGGISPNSAYEKMYGSNFELCWSRNKHKRAIARVLWKGMFGMQHEDLKERLHPTQKPIRLAEWFIEKFSKRGWLIVDLFGGSGSTLIASEQLNRRCFMMEIDPYYVSVIIERWEKFTGKKHKKVS